jgi:NAD(P)-dependent dehydrogenase (short-subunit alcohol dehydrogenase family)
LDRGKVIKQPLRGKVCLVTGGNSGIGASIARACALAGAYVMIVGRDEGRLQTTVQTIQEAGGKCAAFAIDLTSPDAPAGVIASTLECCGGVNAIFHSAGIYTPIAFEDTSEEFFDQYWRVNVRAPFFLTQAALPHFKSGDSITFITSRLGRIGAANEVAYCGTKGALELMAKALAIELGERGIRVNCIAPGAVRTPMNAEYRLDPSFEDRLVQAIPMGRMGETVDVAPAAVFIASDEARYISGATLAIDGAAGAG